jgi:predicted nucleic acid-binding protein
VTSTPIRSVAADSNVLLSAVTGGAARRVFEKAPGVVVVTTEITLAEVEEYLPEFSERYQIDLDVLLDVLALLPVKRYSESAYSSSMKKARQLLDKRDPDDVHLAALALKFEIPIWSNDKDFSVMPLDVYTTARLLKVLEI